MNEMEETTFEIQYNKRRRAPEPSVAGKFCCSIAQLEEGNPAPVCGSLHHPTREQINVQSLQEEELNRAKEQDKKMEQLKNTLNARQLEMALSVHLD